jgi:hypothetical protein
MRRRELLLLAPALMVAPAVRAQLVDGGLIGGRFWSEVEQ